MTELTQKEKKRILWLDAARGIAVLLVVLGHLFEESPVYRFAFPAHHVVYSFHMALFFILSGLTFADRETRFFRFAARRVRTILLPYTVLWILLTFWFLFVKKFQPLTLWNLGSLLWLMRGTSYGYYWFLPGIFTAQCMMYWLKRCPGGMPVQGIIVVALAALGVIGASKGWIPLMVLHLDIAMLGLPFLWLGYQLKMNRARLSRVYNSKWLPAAALAVFIVCNVISIRVLHEQSNFFFNLKISNPLLMVPAAISGSALAIWIARRPFVYNMQPLTWCGKHSLIFFGLHYYALWIAGYGIGKAFLHYNTPMYVSIPVLLLQFLTAVLITSVMVLLYLLIRKLVFRKRRTD